MPYLDVYAMAEAVLNLERDPARRVNLGRCGAARVKDRHDVTVAGPQLLQLMKLTIDRQYAPA